MAGAGQDARRWDAIGTLLSRANDQPGALHAYERALALAPDDLQILFNRAAVRRFLGQLVPAEQDYDRVIELRPHDYEAWRNRSDLRRQTPAHNHVAALEQAAALAAHDWRASVQLQYALAKEFEDLGQHARSFACLELAVRTRRAHLRYDVASDVATAGWIIEAFPAAPAIAPDRSAADAPIFVLGLPRAGSTLVERILASHSGVTAAGELKSLALAVVAAARRSGAPPGATRRQLISAAASCDFAALGLDYLQRARLAGASGDCFIDKMPLNYLYCGWIRGALPKARIVHVSREPMAACYAIYKTLFEDAYPFSYDLSEIARYYVAYRRLMAHWQRLMPDTILSLSYEALVADQRGETRRLLEFCGLEWQAACENFQLLAEASTTASAAQVRQPLYDSSVAQWRHYRTELEPLSRMLLEAGVPVE
jgi:tetratricopeptide (TPR) repeat protein